ncbi:PAS domain-containing sensor histidine kinase [Clostridium sp. CCUG 7971]|uniref:sensor histidine kinase n=1 Tax=Clostridium sp. CCUG 7971 TaxID=2811414 RepID=UPI00257040EC|nr:PAS domain-containing sensor histidine kinase [Clostridium sp. CCUG 7971]
MEDIVSIREKKNYINENLAILFIFIGYILLSYIMKDVAQFEIFVHTIYSTFLIAMGIIVFKSIEFNIDKFCIFLGAVFALTGIIECIYVITMVTDRSNMYYSNNFKVILIAFVDILPMIGIYLSFNHIKRDKNVIMDIIILTVVTTISIFIAMKALSDNSLIKINLMEKENKLLIELIINGFLLLMGMVIYKKVGNIGECLDDQEKYYFKRMIIVISLSRITTLINPYSNNLKFADILSQIITNVAMIYIYNYIVYANFKKPYNKLNSINYELVKKTNILKNNNIKLIEHTNNMYGLKEVLNDKESKLQSTLDVSVNCIIVFNKDKKVTYTNKKFESIFAYEGDKITNSIEESMKYTIGNFDDFIKNVDYVFDGKENLNQIIKVNNNRVYHAAFSPLIIKGNIQGALCILINKTRQIEYGQKIIDANKKSERFLESIGDGIIVFQNGEKIYTNKASKSIFKERLNSIDFNFYRENKNKEAYFKIDGKEVFLEMEFSDYTKNKELNTIVVVRDITSRKRAQMRLRENQKAYSKFIDILPDGICLLNEELQITYANKSLLDMLEINSLNQINNNNIKSIINLTEEEEDLFDRKMKKVISKNKYMLLLEYELITHNKNKVQVEVNATPFFNEDNYIMLIIKDLTYKKTSEMAEKEILDRFKTDKIKTEFFANMSHELKTPLNVISSSNQLLDSLYKNEKIEDYNNSVKSHIDLVRQSSYRLQRLIGNIIDLTKMESGFYRLKLYKYNIVNVVEDLFMKIEEYANKKDISIVFDTDSEEVYVNIDKSEMERIILNLLSNCIKFTDIGGSINVNIYDKGSNVAISVLDNGVGIPKNKIGLIFEEFGQVNKTLSRNAEGSGIGLSIVKNLVELHNGSIYVKSEENKGTEFIIIIPKTNVHNDDYQEDRRIYNIDEKIKIEFSDIYY